MGLVVSRFLITGARSPAALEMVRNLGCRGHQIHLTDSLKYPIARCSKFVSSYHQIASPIKSIESYKNSINQILISNKIDYLLPTCEEVFYISKIKEQLVLSTDILCSDIHLLRMMHSKIKILDLAADCEILIPTTFLVSEQNSASQLHYTDFVLKKEFSRFGNDVVVSPSNKQVKRAAEYNCAKKGDNRYLLQQKITGTEICCYAIAVHGIVNLCACYLPKYRISQSASIYFKSIEDQKILNFVKNIVSKTNFHGQISFDFIRNELGDFLIECNPRATSGVHLCKHFDLAAMFSSAQPKSGVLQKGLASQIKYAMLFFILPKYLFSRNERIVKDYLETEDAIRTINDPIAFIKILQSFFELIIIAANNRQSLRSASTKDIEWDGGSFK